MTDEKRLATIEKIVRLQHRLISALDTHHLDDASQRSFCTCYVETVKLIATLVADEEDANR